MKKSILFIAMLLCSFAASAKVITAVPAGDIAWYLSQAEAGDVIELTDGIYDESSSINFAVNNLTIKAAEGAKPVIKTQGQWMVMNIKATTTFEGITFDSESKSGNNDDNDMYAFKLSANATFKNCVFQDYAKACIQVDEGIVVNSLVIEDCVFDGAVESVNTTKAALFTKGIVTSCTIEDSEFKNFAECAITIEKWYGGRFDALTINGCLIHDCTQSAIYLPYAIDTNEKQTCSDFKLTNSTIYNIGNGESFGTIDIQDNTNIASEQQVLVDHVTIYNFLNSGWHGAIKVEKTANAVVSNCIVMNPEQKWANPYKLFTGAQIKNSLYYNTEYADNSATTTNLVEADPMFVDAANGDFMLYAESPAVGAGTDGSTLGDPRWGVKAGLQPGDKVLSKAVAAAAAGATITLGDGIYEESSSFDFDKEGLTIVAAEGTKPVIKTTGQWTSLRIAASTTFEGITFDGGNLTKTSLDTKGTAAQTLTLRNCEFKNYTDYNINVDENTTINTITIDNCVFDGVTATKAAIFAKGIVTTCTIEDSEFKNYAEYCITANDYYRGRIDGLSINNCLLHDGAVAVYMPIYADAGDIQTCADFSLTNSTIYNMVGTKWEAVIDIRSNPAEAEEALNKVVIDHITLYNFTTTELGGITSRKSTDALITNSIIANPAANANQYAYRLYGTAAINNTLTFNTKTSGGTPTDCLNADPLFVNAAENNFQLYANSPAVGAGTDGNTLGDPRWGVAAKVLGKRINVTPEQASSLPWIIQSDDSNLKPGDTLVLADGTYTLSTIAFSKENLVVMAAENAKPVIANASEWACLELSASTTFDGITFDAGNVAHYIIASKGAASGKFAFVNCEFKGWTTWAISNQYEAGTHVDSVIVDNCLFHDGLGGAISFSGSAPENQQSCQYFKMTNTTLYNLTESSYRGIINVGSNPEEEGKYNEVVIDHITMYNYELTESGIAAIAVRKSTDLKITNSIIANPEDKGYTALNVYGGTVDNTIHYNGSKRSGNTVYTKCENVDPLFVDAANNDFMLQAASPAIGAGTDGSNLGDPRWGVEEPAFITLTTGDNSAVIAANIGKTVDVVIERSFTANDGYYTLCVPFNMPASVIGKAYSLGTITEHVSGQGININLKEENELSAGMPYLVLPKEDMTQLLVEDVTILEDPAAGQGIQNDELNVKIFFQGYYSAPGVTTNGTTEYYVGNKGSLYNEKVEIRGLCGVFTITDTQGQPAKVRARVVAGENEVTGVEDIITNDTPQKMIENGQLIIIRNGLKYNVQGQRL